jgi:hypothetical protein
MGSSSPINMSQKVQRTFLQCHKPKILDEMEASSRDRRYAGDAWIHARGVHQYGEMLF